MAKIISKHTSGNPAGTIIPCGTSTALPRTLLCDGASYSVSAYPALFAAIGYSFGGSGASFNVPDFRGRFLRGVDGTASNDPDKASRTAMNAGGNTGNAIGSVQEDIIKSHTHNMTKRVKWGHGNAAPRGFAGQDGNAEDATFTTDADAGANIKNETRPKNAYVNYCIAY